MYAKFGLDRIDSPGPVQQLLEKVTVGIDSYSVQLILRESYETMYRIFNHDGVEAKARPLALVAMHPKEDSTSFSRLHRTIQRYDKQGIKDMFGLSLTEFLNLPRDYVELLFRLAVEKMQSENPAIDKMARQLAESSKR